MTDERPLAGRTVLVPRSLDRAVGLAARLHELGAEVLVSPVIERAPADDLAALDDAARDLADGAYAWVLVTSVNAVDELAAAWTRVASASLGSAPARWAAVGPSTARALREAGFEPALVPEDHSALGLLAALRSLASPSPELSEAHGSRVPSRSDKSDDGGPRVLLPLGDLAQPTLERGLAAMGARPHVVTAYRTVTHLIDGEVREAWAAGDVDAVVLTSGSVTREVATQLGARDDVVGVAIGSPTARAAEEVGLRVAAVAATADDAGLADATVRALTTPDVSEAHGTPLPPDSDNSRETTDRGASS
ncbi:uroporphyrinogen-III synthase [Luteimicrobium sp. NPDC057192]|uniref:uroporphyrinogen-III synthase n=1 Tax=Luteimicrobium sp. NPDC057192 TaxID=3346042 RepID=UPI0036359443